MMEFGLNDGTALPEHVCGYLLSVYYEINIQETTVQIEYYCKGRLYKNTNGNSNVPLIFKHKS